MQKSYPTNAPTTPDRQTTDDRTTYKLNSGLFFGTTAQRTVLKFFPPNILKNNFSLSTLAHLQNHTSRHTTKVLQKSQFSIPQSIIILYC